MSAAVETASTVETAAAVDFTSATETAASVEAISATHLTAGVAASVATVVNPALESRVRIVAMSPTGAAIIAAIPEPRRVAPVVPRADADEHSIHEIVGTIIAVRRTGIWIIIVVSVGTSWRPSHITRTDSYSNPNSNLRLRISKWHHQDRQQRDIFQITHTHLRLPEPLSLLLRSQEAFQSCYLLEPRERQKVSEIKVVDFNHPA